VRRRSSWQSNVIQQTSKVGTGSIVDDNCLFSFQVVSPGRASVVRQAHHERERCVRQAHHERNNQDTVKIPFTLSRELAERSKGVFGVLQEAHSS